jgi:hypothetical protein
MAKITLTFDEDNNFDPTLEKTHTTKDHEFIIQNAQWIINCALSTVSRDSKRYGEMVKLHENLTKQVKFQTTDDNEILKPSSLESYSFAELKELALANPNDSAFGKLIRDTVIK